MVLARRLKNLERDRVVHCHICHGQGRIVIETINSPFRDEDDEPVDKSGCPECGWVKVVQVRYVRETAIRR